MEAAGFNDFLNHAQGGLLDMNGYYSAGVLEGLVHFLMYTLDWLQKSSTGEVPEAMLLGAPPANAVLMRWGGLYCFSSELHFHV